MLDPITTLAIATGGGLLGAGLGAQVRAQRLRRTWVRAGLGMEERATGLASLAAIPVVYPTELQTAEATDTQLAVVVMRRFTEHPEAFGRRLGEATRAHETGWRIDYDLFAATLVVDDRNAAVLAAARLGRAACGAESTKDLRIGIAMCPDDADELLDAVDVASRRMRGFSIVDAVATQLRIAA